MPKKIATVLGIFFLAMLAVVLPATLTGDSLNPFCDVSSAAAQDSPCLEQAATNSALQLELLDAQATSNAQSFQIFLLYGTVDALQNREPVRIVVTVPILITTTPSPPPTQVTASDLSRNLPENCILYTVAAGDTPIGIAEMHGVNIFDLMEANGLDEESGNALQIGQELIIPLAGCDMTTQDNAAPVSNLPLPPTAVNAQIQITQVLSPGDITAESIEIRNMGNVINLAGWTLSNAMGNTVFTFPDLRLFSNGLVTVYTRQGQATPIALFWGLGTPVWHSGDIVILANASGEAQTTFEIP